MVIGLKVVMDASRRLDEEFKKYIQIPFERWDIVQGTLLIARQEYPDLGSEKYSATITAMSEEATRRLTSAVDKHEQLNKLNDYFFGELGFEGNREDYQDPKNSYLPDVLDRRKGIPISLSALYLRFAWAAGLPLFGINFPGHFLVAYKESEIEIDRNLYIDVFNGGKILGTEELTAKIQRPGQRAIKLEPALHLRNAGVRHILHRMLGNLKAIHASQGRLERALWTVEWRLLLLSNDWESYRDKGLFCYSLGRMVEAEKALVTYLEHFKKPDDYAQVWRTLYAIRAGNPANLN